MPENKTLPGSNATSAKTAGQPAKSQTYLSHGVESLVSKDNPDDSEVEAQLQPQQPTP